jgi:hypothetical protein
VKAVLRREGRTAVVSVSFVGRDRMRGLHRRYKGARRVTDVLAFTLRGRSRPTKLTDTTAVRPSRRSTAFTVRAVSATVPAGTGARPDTVTWDRGRITPSGPPRRPG